MEKDAKKLIDDVKSMKNGEKILNNLDKLKNFAVSPEGKALISTLGKRGAELVQRAATDIPKGDVSSAAELLGLLTSSKEGKALMDKIMTMTGM